MAAAHTGRAEAHLGPRDPEPANRCDFRRLAWIDKDTQAFLDVLADSIAVVGALLLVSYRPEYRHAWSNKSYYSQVWLSTLGPEDAEAMLSALLGKSSELDDIKRLIIERTEGNPFFIEEMVHALFDEGALCGMVQ